VKSRTETVVVRPAGRHHYVDLTEELGMRPLTAQCHFGLGRLGQRAGQPQLSEPHLTTATIMFREMGMAHWLKRAETAMALLTSSR